MPDVACPNGKGHVGIVGLVNMDVHEEGEHADIAGNGKDIERGRCLLADVDFLMCDVVAYGEGSGYPYPARKQKARVTETASERKHREGDICVDGINGQQTDDGGLWCVVEEPSRHEAVGKEEAEVARGKTLGQRDEISQDIDDKRVWHLRQKACEGSS